MDGVASDDRPAGRSGSHVGSSTESMSNHVSYRSTLKRQNSVHHLEMNANVDDTNVRRKQSIKIRKKTEASGLRGQLMNNIKRLCPCRRRRKKEPSKKNDDIRKKTQWTVNTKSTVKEGNFLKRSLVKIGHLICIGSASELFEGRGFSRLGRFFANHLNWLFRIPYFAFIVYAAVWFYALVILFAGFITAAGNKRPECVLIGGDNFGHADTQFSDAFSLSWATFSTVGYGSAYPALSGNESRKIAVCESISMLCVIESFFGILYGAVIGSILFGRLARVQSRAQVVFSDPVLVRFGSGVKGYGEEGEDEEEGHKLPCPVLEFRIANLLHDYPGGEILDASINIVASLDAEETDAELREVVTATDYMKAMLDPTHLMPILGISNHNSETNDDPELGSTTLGHSSLLKKSSGRTSFKTLNMRSSALRERFLEEDSSSSLAKRRVFMPLVLENPEHPYFKRVWIGRHILDSHSPLLTAAVRKCIHKNNGHWPEELNCAEKVRESLCFNEILVSLNGILNASATEVYEQKIYDYVDLAVGYHFVNLLYKNNDENLKVDIDLINDVQEQIGGGGEYLLNR